TMGNKKCLWHGENQSHNTDNCFKVQKLVKQAKDRYDGNKSMVTNDKKKVRPLIESDGNDENKNNFIYSIFKQRSKNPFYVSGKLQLNEEPIKILLDTGADITVIPSHLVNKKKLKIQKYSGSVRSASEHNLKIIGQADNIELQIQNEHFSVSGVIAAVDWNYIIIGCDTLLKMSDILIKTIREWSNDIETKKSDLSKIQNLLNDQERKEKKMKEEYKSLFARDIHSGLPRCEIGTHEINTGNAKPIFCKPDKRLVHYDEIISKEIEKLEHNGLLVPSNSQWNTRIVPVPKPDGSIRMCLDFRPLNSVCIRDNYQMQNVEDILDRLAKASFFTTLDATSGYYQIPLEQDSQEKTAFTWNRKRYQFTRMPFGLVNAPASFQKMMDTIFSADTEWFVIPYLDDIIIFSENLEEHEKHVRHVLEKLKKYKIYLNEKKCKFFKCEIKILGQIIRKNQRQVDPQKIEGIEKCALPENITDLQSFLGFANYCRSFIPKYAEIAQPLYDLLKGKQRKSVGQVIHTRESEVAFRELKKAIKIHLIRHQPDISKDFILTTDASTRGISAILAQCNEKNEEVMISCFSRTLNKAEENYSATDLELLAVVKSLEHFRQYLLGKKFRLRTDHMALTYIQQCKNQTSRLMRWSLKIQEYEFS
ncbi:LTR retrotransposon, partial [Pseudoloma neurophilia]